MFIKRKGDLLWKTHAEQRVIGKKQGAEQQEKYMNMKYLGAAEKPYNRSDLLYEGGKGGSNGGHL